MNYVKQKNMSNASSSQTDETNLTGGHRGKVSARGVPDTSAENKKSHQRMHESTHPLSHQSM
jgi:hypothetical protein